jgi:hypothetical protein
MLFLYPDHHYGPLDFRERNLPKASFSSAPGIGRAFLFSIDAAKSESRPVPRRNVSGRFLQLGPVYAWLAIDRSQVF